MAQSSKLSGSPKPDACKIVHGRIKLVVPQARRACEKKSYTVLPHFIAPRYNAKLAYRHDSLKSRFIYVIIPSL
jgi:hypothetical protein